MPFDVYILTGRHIAIHPRLPRIQYLIQPSNKKIRAANYTEALGNLILCQPHHEFDRVIIGRYKFLVTILCGQECVRLDHLSPNHRHELWRIGSFDGHLGNPNIWVPINEARRAVKLSQPNGYLQQ